MNGPTLSKVLQAGTLSSMLLAISMIFFYLPPMKDAAGNVLDNSFNIFYFHMPIAIIAYIAFTVVFLSSIQFLRSADMKWDILARSGAGVGVLFAFLVLATGSIWAKATWGWYWVWEIRLTTSLVLFLVYVSYFLLRQALEEPARRARLAAVFGIVGFASVPLSFLSIRLWRSAHPLMFGGSSYGGSGGGLEGTSLQLTLAVNFIAFMLLFITLVDYKIKNEKLQEQLEQICYNA